MKFSATSENPLDDEEDEKPEPTPVDTSPTTTSDHPDAEYTPPVDIGQPADDNGDPVDGDEGSTGDIDIDTTQIGDDFKLGRRQWDEIVGGVTGGLADGQENQTQTEGQENNEGEGHGEVEEPQYEPPMAAISDDPESTGSEDVEGVTTYSSPIIYAVRKTGYYCIGKSTWLKLASFANVNL